MTHRPDDPQIHQPAAPNLPAGVRLDKTDPQERGMPLAQQPTHADDSPRRRLGRGERLAIIIAVLVTVGAISGIAVLATQGDSNGTATPTLTPTPTPATPSLTTQPPSAQDVAIAAAEARYREFLRVRDAVGQGGYRTSKPFDAVTVPPERDVQEISFRQARLNPGLHQVGTTTVAALMATLVQLHAAAGGYPEIVLQACLDVTGVDVLDRQGHSVVTANRAPRSRSTVRMYEYTKGTKGATAGGWYVYEATAKGEQC
jgi:pyruvate/2-oxoglutarate dehydrogenase complex dihydrolipoamide acyltransferase (E2) component